MLFLITYGLKQESSAYDGFFQAMARLGPCVEVPPGVALCSAVVSAAVIASELRRHLSPQDRLVVVQMYRGHCAGLLNETQKRHIRNHIGPDPLETLLPPRANTSRRQGA